MEKQPISQYRVIRTALVSGVVLFGLIIWYLLGQGTMEPADTNTERMLQFAFAGIALGGLTAIAVVRSAQAKATTFQRRGSLAIVGWAIGEGIALFGGVIYLLTTEPALYIVGLVVFLATLLMVPAPEAS